MSILEKEGTKKEYELLTKLLGILIEDEHPSISVPSLTFCLMETCRKYFLPKEEFDDLIFSMRAHYIASILED
ncbi:MAG TPA: hypothetical protein VGF75_07085 [Candidatus Saccharimonadales bacterium]